MDCSLPGSSVIGISQARRLEWVAISFSRGSSQLRASITSPAWQADALPLSHLGSPSLSFTRYLMVEADRMKEIGVGEASLVPLTFGAPPAPPSTRRSLHRQQPQKGRWAARATLLSHQEALESTPRPSPLQPECSTIIWPERWAPESCPFNLIYFNLILI